ncbi:MAG: glucosaminidase domain-containing protein [Prevotella sp.]|nr:glucosaminidase domain-containing protein [Prevotella sp.]
MKRTLLICVCLVLCANASLAQVRWNADFQAYIDQYKDIAIEEMMTYRIPASITLAQGLLESGAGKSYLSTRGNNHFGIKCNGWTGKTIRHDDDKKQEKFRAYDSARESYEDHSKFLAYRERYKKLFDLKTTDYVGWANGLKECGYATNPQYAQRLISIIETYKLYQYDTMTTKQNNKPVQTVTQTEVAKRTSYQIHPIKAYNQNYYVYARKGDSYESIGKEVGVSAANLAKYNEREKGDQLHEGEVVYLRKKQKKADRKYKNQCHVVAQGESMYSISQKYGMRLASLYKINHLEPSYQIKVGDLLKVY